MAWGQVLVSDILVVVFRRLIKSGYDFWKNADITQKVRGQDLTPMVALEE